MKVKRLMAAMGLAAVSVASTGALAAVDPALPSYTKTSGVSATCPASVPTRWPT